MKIILLFFVFISSSLSIAEIQTGKITGYIPYEAPGKQVLIFKIQGSAPSGCNTTGRLAIDSTSLKFKATQAAVMSAFHSQSDVTVLIPQLTCNAWSNSWDVEAVCVGLIPC
ncbi:hypothetical protein [Iodobacter ciconiae]|uniref:Uncharacterized protein n=1 Tax=Iodobacter ciconiae TaxID=2496266 RepID=A0A3S8ZP12_9NEIS|nr:hypothetical protein [Iodobacter ciconiae]AZN35139.1 hypothetical protein EJO50_00745 [Iodobacter ciconiae]